VGEEGEWEKRESGRRGEWVKGDGENRLN